MKKHVTLENVSLELVCQQQNEQFKWLSKGEAEITRVIRTPSQDVDFPSLNAMMYCGRVNDAVIFGKSYVCDQPGRAVFLNQSHRNYLPSEFSQYYVDDLLKERATSPIIEEECCFLGGFSGDTKFFGHFVFEFLYRLAAFDMCGVLDKYPVAVFDDVPDAWLSFIELYGVPKDQILRVPQHPAPKFNKVWVTSCPNYLAANKKHYAFWDEGIQRLRDKILARVPTNGGPKRVFLGRKDARHRRLVNEDEVWKMLSEHGFSYPEFMGKSAADQISYVASAEVIVAVTGSSSSMTQFAREDCEIIDIFPNNLIGGLGSMGFAALLGQSYRRILASEVPSENSGQGIDSDLSVNVGALHQALSTALNSRT